MSRIKKCGKTHSVRFPVEIDKQFIEYCAAKKINESDAIQECIRCFFEQSDCIARMKLDKRR